MREEAIPLYAGVPRLGERETGRQRRRHTERERQRETDRERKRDRQRGVERGREREKRDTELERGMLAGRKARQRSGWDVVGTSF